MASNRWTHLESIRANANETNLWLAAIFSWLTSYPWHVDLLIVIFVNMIHLEMMKSIIERSKASGHGE